MFLHLNQYMRSSWRRDITLTPSRVILSWLTQNPIESSLHRHRSIDRLASLWDKKDKSRSSGYCSIFSLSCALYLDTNVQGLIIYLLEQNNNKTVEQLNAGDPAIMSQFIVMEEQYRSCGRLPKWRAFSGNGFCSHYSHYPNFILCIMKWLYRAEDEIIPWKQGVKMPNDDHNKTRYKEEQLFRQRIEVNSSGSVWKTWFFEHVHNLDDASSLVVFWNPSSVRLWGPG